MIARYEAMETYERFKTNRQKRMSPKSGLFWCHGCDRQIVSVGKKCKVCGSIHGVRTIKHEAV